MATIPIENLFEKEGRRFKKSSGRISRENHDLKTFMHPSTALFTIAKTWKQHKCPLRKERIKIYIYIFHTVEY